MIFFLEVKVGRRPDVDFQKKKKILNTPDINLQSRK